MNKKLFIGIGIVLVLLIIGCTILIVKINSEPKQEEKIEEKVQDSKEEKKSQEKKTEEKKTEEKKEESKKTEEKKSEEKKTEEKKEEKTTDGDSKKVPDLTGLTLEEATEKLNSSKIASSFSIRRMDSDKPKDTIVKTEPAAGATYEGKLEIVFYLSNGPKTNN